MNLLITICARGGSKGIPNKNLKNLARKPMLYYSIQAAKSFGKLRGADYGFSTDSSDIRKLGNDLDFGTDYIRPEHLATDSAGKIDTIKDVMLYEEKRKNKKYDYVLDLDATSPLRTVEDLETAYKIIQKNESALNLFSVSKPHRNPYFNQVERTSNGYYRLVKIPDVPVKTRQSAPEVWDLNASFYFFKREFFELGYQNAYTDRSLIYVVPHICFDLDEPIDFEFMSYLIENKKLDFEFDYQI